ncbi:hypothetical protein [Dictyobacter arantiisoli]|uniref:hypothetical protein n=1 Tax=Dictyobacter arantiisoli TaxID=2014874 RepID=UPI00155A3FE9|nr:hypothetical protein [Dictyobacter arantiisoli]
MTGGFVAAIIACAIFDALAVLVTIFFVRGSERQSPIAIPESVKDLQPTRP